MSTVRSLEPVTHNAWQVMLDKWPTWFESLSAEQAATYWRFMLIGAHSNRYPPSYLERSFIEKDYGGLDRFTKRKVVRCDSAPALTRILEGSGVFALITSVPVTGKKYPPVSFLDCGLIPNECDWNTIAPKITSEMILALESMGVIKEIKSVLDKTSSRNSVTRRQRVENLLSVFFDNHALKTPEELMGLANDFLAVAEAVSLESKSRAGSGNLSILPKSLKVHMRGETIGATCNFKPKM